MVDISQMPVDLAKATQEHVEAFRKEMNDLVAAMRTRLLAFDSPMHGVSVQSVVTTVDGYPKLTVDVRPTGSPLGTVHGGQARVEATVQRTLDQMAKEAGLDRRG
jgi:hypothetical protein